MFGDIINQYGTVDISSTMRGCRKTRLYEMTLEQWNFVRWGSTSPVSFSVPANYP